MRLNRYLAACGLGSRRKCELLIRDCRVSVNGETVFELSTVVDPRFDKVALDGLPVRPPSAKTYILVNKPEGFLTTASDPQGRPTVMDLLPPGTGRLFPVGRLDSDTTGLLLFTDDGKLAFRLAHPRYGIDKKYVVATEERPTKEDLNALRHGIELEDGPTRPAKVRLLSVGSKGSKVEITIHEGRKRQVRRMMRALDYHVIGLERVGLAFLKLGDMKPGGRRVLKAAEVQKLRKMVGLYPLP